jgi:hypothetical protein
LHGVLENTPGGSELINTLSTDFSAVRTLDSELKLGVQEAYIKAFVTAISSLFMKIADA